MFNIRAKWFTPVLLLFMCVQIVVGSTLAYFVDEVSTTGNIVTAGRLKAGMDWAAEMPSQESDWQDASTGTIFNDRLWEPGFTSVRYIRVRNEGTLAFQYELNLVPDYVVAGGANLLDVIDVYFGVMGDEPITRANYTTLNKVGVLSDLLKNENGAGFGIMLPEKGAKDAALPSGVTAYTGSEEFVLVLHMQETAGNEYMNASVGDGFKLQLVATQYTYENDAFGNDYDTEAELPDVFVPTHMVINVTPDENGLVPQDVEFVDGNGTVTAVVPAGAKMADGATQLRLIIETKDRSDANVHLDDDQVLTPYEVRIEGLAKDNTVPARITMAKAMTAGLNIGNYTLYHVENGASNKMTRVDAVDAASAHNAFAYDPATGDVTVAMATFSEVAVVAEPAAWEGKFDYSWYTNAVALADGEAVTEYTIANGDQLAGFGAIVGGMDGQTQDSFAGKTVKLISDINLGDKESENKSNIIFYPIGYYNSEGTYERTNTAITSGLRNFEGTFDGNGHTIANFYHNTWEMKGDHDWYSPEEQYYRDGMGLFGRVYKGTVKNLTVDHFSSDGEIATTGVIAAYADGATFENIAITNCNPRVYNIGNGGIVGCVGWYAKEAGLETKFKNITVDNSNKISALWGSYDVACGGIVGQYYPISGQTSANKPTNGGIDLVNCHVSAQMDVYNDVCANYQYYAYRYAGMMIGSIRENTTNEDGKSIPDMTGISATGCTVNYGDWNDYYYCEFEKNGHPSYSGPDDYKFSRVPHSELNFTDSNGNGVVDANERASVTGCKHEHTAAEDNQAIFLPFYQLFTGYGWGVNSVGLKEYSGIVTNLDITEGEQEESVVKFDAVTGLTELKTGCTVNVGELFEANKSATVGIVDKDVNVFVSPVGDESTVSGTYIANTEDWTQGTLTFAGVGKATITITDYYFCESTKLDVTIAPRSVFNVTFKAEETVVAEVKYTEGDEKLESIPDVPNKDGYTGVWEEYDLSLNQDIEVNAVYTPIEYTLIFKTNGVEYTQTYTVETNKADIELPAISEREGYIGSWPDFSLDIGGTTVEAVYTPIPARFEPVFKHTDKFTYRVGNKNTVNLSSLFKEVNGASIIKELNVTIETEAGNAEGVYTSNSSWKNGTIQFSGTGLVKVQISAEGATPATLTLEVVDAVNATTATSATKNNVVLLDNCGFSSLEVSGGYTLYGNGFTMTCEKDTAALNTGYEFVAVNNGILDNVQIECPNFDYAVLYSSNMTESGNRSETTDKTRYFNVKSAVEVNGNSRILNSRISGGRAAVNVVGGNVVIENSRIELGAVASLLVGTANSLTLRDVTLVQEPTASTHDPNKTLMGFSVLFICDANGDTAPVTLEGTLVQNAWVSEKEKQYVPSAGQSIISTVLGKTEYLHDIDGDGTPESLNLGFAYMPESLTSKVNTTTITDNRTDKETIPYDYAEVSILSGKTYVYSYKNSNNGTADSFKTESEYKPNKYGDIITVTYNDTMDGLESGKSFGTDGWVYELNVDLDKASGYKLDFSKLSMVVNGVEVTDYKVNGGAKPTSPAAVTAGGTTYTLTATIDDKEYTATYKVTGTETSKESPSLVGTPSYGAGFGVANSYNGDWSAAAPVLDGITIKYWSVADSEYKEFALSSITFANTGKQNGSNSYWEYTHTNNDFTLKLTNTIAIHDKSQTFGMPVAGKDGKLYFTIAGTGGFVGNGTSSRSITIKYEFTDNNGGETLTFTNTWNIAQDETNQYNYNSFVKDGTLTKLEASSSGGSCVTPETLVTLANGTQVRVDSLTGSEELLVWNMETGMLDAAPIMFVDNDPEADYEIVHLYFSDGTDVKVIYEHGFWDYDLNKYVYLDANAAQYIGHTFAKQNGNELAKVQLTDVVIETETTTAWSPVTAGHLCYFVNGMLSMPGGVGGLFNIFDVNPDTMTYDVEAMQRDIETYGLYTYEELNAIVELPEEMFDAAGGAYMKISIGKGNMTMDELIEMIERYTKFF